MVNNRRHGQAAALANARWMALSQMLGMALRLCYVLAAARLLGAEDYGLLAYSQSWYVAALPLALLGVSIQLGRSIGADAGAGVAFAAATRPWRLAVATLTAGAVVILAALVEPLPTQVLAIGIFALTLVPRVSAAGSEAVLTGLEQANQSFVNHVAWRSAELATAVLVLIANGGVLALAALHAASWSAQALTGYRRERRLARTLSTSEKVTGTAASLFRDGLPIALAATVNGLLVSGLLILYRLRAGVGDDLGAVALFLQMVGMLLGLGVAVGNALLPHLARRGRRADDPLPGRIMAAALALAALGTLTASLASPWLPALLGAGFAPLRHWLALLAFFAGLIIAGTLLARVLVVHGGAPRLLTIAVIAVGLALLAALVLIPLFDGLGVLIAALVGYALQAGLVALAVCDSLALPRRILLIPGFGLGLIGLLVLAAPAAPGPAVALLLLIATVALIAARGRAADG